VARPRDLASRAFSVGSTDAPLSALREWIDAEFPRVREETRTEAAAQALRCLEVIDANEQGRATDADARTQLRTIAEEVRRWAPD
jgi:hypothetical protein